MDLRGSKLSSYLSASRLRALGVCTRLILWIAVVWLRRSRNGPVSRSTISQTRKDALEKFSNVSASFQGRLPLPISVESMSQDVPGKPQGLRRRGSKPCFCVCHSKLLAQVCAQSPDTIRWTIDLGASSKSDIYLTLNRRYVFNNFRTHVHIRTWLYGNASWQLPTVVTKKKEWIFDW